MSESFKICIQRAETRQEWDEMQADYIWRALLSADRIEKLEAALRPFAKWADAYDPEENDDDREAWDHAPTIGMLRAARNAMGELKGK